MKQLFTFRIVYFKESGKFYTESSFKCECGALDSGGPVLTDMFHWLNDAPLWPGLNSDKWNGPIMVEEIETRLPMLIVSKNLGYAAPLEQRVIDVYTK